MTGTPRPPSTAITHVAGVTAGYHRSLAGSDDDGDKQLVPDAVKWAGFMAGTGLGAWHGYKRTNSTGWAIGWALLGGMFWPIAIPLMFAQGLGKRGQ
tara:strand:+ start:1409 stop:1699 length:291 start_codon:yes stop_codon:yes gene_type:complete